MYYSASRFGSNASCIGHATTASLDAPAWVDQGSAVICSTASDAFNAIDPAVVLDAVGKPWLAFGSFWSGLKMIPLTDEGVRDGIGLYPLASRPNTAVEAPFVIRHDGMYYLFESVDYCCRGIDSTYKILVGRSSAVTGPYVDRVGNPLLSGGGTLLVEGDTRWRGPGHSAMIEGPSGWYNVYHAYDADNAGVPTLRIAEVTWADDGWPVSAGP
ncbi:MAG: arabinan endo-1,5-alpha-L-arabinosidase [Myxococcota bacterium]